MTWGCLPHFKKPASPSTPLQKAREGGQFLPSGRKKESPWPTAGRRWTGNQGRWAARKKRWIPRGVCKCHSQPPPPSASISPNFFASTTASLCRQAGSPAGGFRIPRASAIPEATALGQPRVNGRCVDTWYRAEPYGIQTAELFVGERVLDLGGRWKLVPATTVDDARGRRFGSTLGGASIVRSTLTRDLSSTTARPTGGSI